MDPITIALIAGAAIQVVSGLMQSYQAEKARGATNARLKEIQAMFDAIVPPDLDLEVFDDPAMASEIQAPQLNVEAITPEVFEIAGTYNPEVADFVRENGPALIQASEAAETGRGAQLDALERYKQIASGEYDPEFAARMDEASQRANREAQSRSDSIIQDANRRGTMGSGFAFAAQQKASTDAMARAAEDSRFAAAEAYRNQLMATDKSAELGGDIRNSEMSEEARNVAIINDFNERTSRNYQDYLTAKAESMNKAKLINMERQQRVSDLNTNAANESKWRNREMYNDAQMTGYNVKRQQRQDKLDIVDRKQRTKQQMYENLLAKARGKAGIAQQGIDYLRDDARDSNQRTQGIADAATSGAMMYGKYGKRSPEQELGVNNGRDLPMDNQYDYDTEPGQDYRYSPTDRWRTS